MPGGDKFGPRNSLSCILKGIEKGFCGNKNKDCVKTGYHIVDFSRKIVGAIIFLLWNTVGWNHL